MLTILISAFSISLAAALTPGPVIAVTLAKSYRSPWAGFQVAIGGLVAEVPVILLIYFGFARFLQSTIIQLILGIAGGLMLIFLGMMLFRRRSTVFQYGKDLPVSAFRLGFLTALINPGMVIWWATVGALLISQISAYGINGLIWLILAIELPNFLWYSTASVLFHRYNNLWSSQVQSILIIVFSFVLAGFGIWFIANAIISIM
ncbi:MAG: LysE family transporter [Dehalococcoidales bacterium]|jgi:threonine/homoserine/homoserine lactone efflux protein|nr:LysE family transporter [Dehalococcoidales bacterium]MDX9986756.1 LysE family transporter [Dehalococcoidales bacterium]